LKRALCIAALAAAAAGCQAQFDPASYVTGLRVLDIKAEPPELAPGETTQLSALYYNNAVSSDAGAAPITREWAYCTLPPPPGVAVNKACALDDDQPYIVPLAGQDPLAFVMPQVDPTKLGTPDVTLGVYLPVRLRVHAGSDTLTAVYRLRFATGLTPRNHNPHLLGMFIVAGPGFPDAGIEQPTPLDDANPPPPFHAGASIRLRATIDIDSWEELQTIGGDQSMPRLDTTVEQPRFLWYATAGTFNADVTKLDRPDTALTLDKHLEGLTQVKVWVVVHDERGGSDFLERTLPLAP
jgi:hypothetical protein